MNVSAAELILNSADDLLAKACVNEKGQKTLIKNLASENREEILNDCSAEAALKAVTNATFLATSDGRKLAKYLIQKIGFQIVWKTVKIKIKVDSSIKRFCFYFGQTLICLWKKLVREESEEENEELNERTQLEQTIFEDLFQLAICSERKYSEKFLTIIEGVADNKPSAVSQMIFRVSNHVLWRALDAPNMICRYNAAGVFLRVYPIEAASDEDLDYDLKEKQFEIFQQLLLDDCYQIRVDTIKAIFNFLSLVWPLIKPFHRKTYLALIIDELAFDEVPEVRLAIYESLPLLYSCSNANNIVEHALMLIAQSGLNDPKDKIRLATVNALLKLENHTVSLMKVITLEELLACLDIEVSEEVEKALVKLLLPIVCLEDASMDPRFRNAEEICRTSRGGSLKFHTLMGKHKMITNRNAHVYIKMLIIGILRRLQLKGDEDESQLELDITQTGVDFTTVKTILDCSIILFVSMYSTLLDDPEQKYYNGISALLAKTVTRILDGRYKNTIIGESALVALTCLPQTSFPNTAFIRNEVYKGDYDSPSMPFYVLSYAHWDANELVRLIEHGLFDIAKRFNVNKTIKKNSSNLGRFELPSDKSKDKIRKPIEFISMCLNSVPINEYLMKTCGVYVRKWREILQKVIKVMPSLVGNQDEILWTRMYEVYSLLIICIQVEANSTNPEYDSENRSDIPKQGADTFEKELHWFYGKFNAKELTPRFVLQFLKLAKYHFECCQQRESTCESVVTFCERISSFVNLSEIESELKANIVLLQKAAIDAFPFCTKAAELHPILEEAEEISQSRIDQSEVMDNTDY